MFHQTTNDFEEGHRSCREIWKCSRTLTTIKASFRYDSSGGTTSLPINQWLNEIERVRDLSGNDRPCNNCINKTKAEWDKIYVFNHSSNLSIWQYSAQPGMSKAGLKPYCRSELRWFRSFNRILWNTTRDIRKWVER